MTNLTFKQLEAVHQVARSGTVVKAAESLHVTPAALTSRIKLLEEDLGLALFDRTGNRLRPTDAGREAVAAAARIDRVISDLGDTLEAMKGLHGGRVRFGAVSTAKYFAAELIAAFLRQHAGIDLQLVVGNRAETVESLRNYDIDMAVMGRPPGDFGAESEPFGPHPYVMIAPADHRLARAKRVSKAELSSQKFIVREEGSGTREIINQLLIPYLHHLRPGIEFGNPEAIKRAAASGLGITCLSRFVVDDLLRSGVLVAPRTELPPLTRRFYLVMHERKKRTRGLDMLIEYLMKHGYGVLDGSGVKGGGVS